MRPLLGYIAWDGVGHGMGRWCSIANYGGVRLAYDFGFLFLSVRHFLEIGLGYRIYDTREAMKKE